MSGKCILSDVNLDMLLKWAYLRVRRNVIDIGSSSIHRSSKNNNFFFYILQRSIKEDEVGSCVTARSHLHLLSSKLYMTAFCPGLTLLGF